MECCVPFCNNNSNTNLQGITFHIFPTEPHLRAAWLRTLGLEGCEVSGGEVICSQHFLMSNFIEVHNRLRDIRDGEIPFPLQVCLICLNTDGKLISLRKMKLQTAYENLTGLSLHSEEYLTESLCVECTQRLINYNKFRNKSLKAHSLLLELVAENAVVTMEQIKKINRESNQLSSDLVSIVLNPDHCNLFINECTTNGNEVCQDVAHVEINIEDKDMIYQVNNSTETELSNVTSNGSDSIPVIIKRENNFDESIHLKTMYLEIDGEKWNTKCPSTDVKVKPYQHESNEITFTSDDGSLSIFTPELIATSGQINLLGDPLLTIDSEKIKHTVIKSEENDINYMSSETLKTEEDILKMKPLIYNKSKTYNLEEIPITYLDSDINKKDKLNRISQYSKLKTTNHKIKSNIVGNNLKKYLINTKTDIDNDVKNMIHIQVDGGKSEEIVLNRNIKDHTLSKSNKKNMKYSNNPLSCKICQIKFEQRTQLRNHMKTHNDGKMLYCRFCQEFFDSKDDLTVHLQTHTRKKQFPCNICHKMFSRKYHLSIHMMTHTGEKPFKCTICPNKYRAKFNLDVHMTTHTGEKSFVCELCQKRFARQDNLNTHMKTHNGEKFTCDICNKLFSNTKYLFKHILNHADKELFACDICKRVFSHKGNLKTHMKSHNINGCSQDYTSVKPFTNDIFQKELTDKEQLHTQMTKHTGDASFDSVFSPKKITFDTKVSENVVKIFKCEICQKSFSRKHNFDTHKQTHAVERPFTCDLCHKTFSRKIYLYIHMKTHCNIANKPFVCDICQKAYLEKSKLIYHLKTHTDDKPFTCDICQKTFATKRNLNLHFKGHTGEKSFLCDICSKSFKLKSILNNHLKTHTGNKPFKCDICQKAFARKYHLEDHQKIHTGEKEFACEICPKLFSRKSNLNAHLRCHTREKQFPCEICLKNFSRKDNLVVHMMSHTGAKPFQCVICQKKYTSNNKLVLHMKSHTGDRPFTCEICEKKFPMKSHLNQHIKTHW